MAVPMTLGRLTRRNERTAWTSSATVAGALAVLFVAAPPFARISRGQDTPTVRQLSDAVKDADARVRLKALNALAMKGPEALEPLSVLVGDPVRNIRSDAITAVLAIYVQ